MVEEADLALTQHVGVDADDVEVKELTVVGDFSDEGDAGEGGEAFGVKTIGMLLEVISPLPVPAGMVTMPSSSETPTPEGALEALMSKNEPLTPATASASSIMSEIASASETVPGYR
ncbi:MAG: hypothetical protein ACTHUY_11525 [Flaviflexus sp.]|uniref:hypothetical protein n=1 Tax=Flaviflexus sp. TaxID=1969482 RepID=UPI003F9233FD